MDTQAGERQGEQRADDAVGAPCHLHFHFSSVTVVPVPRHAVPVPRMP